MKTAEQSTARKKSNVFVIDRVSQKIVSKYASDEPEKEAMKHARGYQPNGRLQIQNIPTEKYPTRKGIDTDCDYFIHFLA